MSAGSDSKGFEHRAEERAGTPTQKGLAEIAELAGSEAEFQSLVDHSPDIVLRIDRAGTILFINRSQIQQSQKLESLGLLAGGVAHDFNNLLMGVLGNASLVLMGMTPGAPHYEHLKGTENAARRAACSKPRSPSTSRSNTIARPSGHRGAIKVLAARASTTTTRRRRETAASRLAARRLGLARSAACRHKT